MRRFCAIRRCGNPATDLLCSIHQKDNAVICEPCKRRAHDACTNCPCQHADRR